MGEVKLIAKANTAQVVTAPDVSVLVAASDVYTATAAAIVTGDLSFGAWHMSVADDCSTAASAANTLVINAAGNSAVVPDLNYVTGQSLCVTVDGVAVIGRDAAGYVITTDENDDFAATVGSVVYDTSNITVPYLTTFSGYNQRIYILNTGKADANYTTTFQTEVGTTAEDGVKASGTVAAGSMLVIKASDMVTFTGTTRGGAVIEIEADDLDIQATSQTVNKTDAGTDTLVLTVNAS
jgi:hypothetical protein